MDIPRKNDNSLFSSVFGKPQPEAAPAAVPPQRPAAVPSDQASALEKKIEALEKNIVEKLEKRLMERPPSTAIPTVLSKISEMESQFREFRDKLQMETAQLRNIGESKTGTRREIEELLKTVREQQKYTEMDRQMHAQLEKAWARVEEMERRMLEAYASSAQRSPAPEPQQVPVPEIAAAVVAAFDGRLAARLRQLDDFAAALQSAKSGELPELLRALDVRESVLAARLDNGLGVISSEIKRIGSDVSSGKERLHGLASEVKSGLGEMLAQSNDRAWTGVVRHLDASALDNRERLDVMSRMVIAHIDSFSAAHAAEAGKISELASGIGGMGEAERALRTSVDSLKQTLLEKLDALALRSRESDALQMEKIRAAFSLSTADIGALSSVVGEISAIETKLMSLLAGVKHLLADIGPENLGSASSGLGPLAQKSLESLPLLCSELERGSIQIGAKRAEIEANLSRLHSEPGIKK